LAPQIAHGAKVEVGGEMSRLIHWNDEYCPNGHRWVFCADSTLHPDYYYCPEEDLMWEPTVKPLDEAEVKEQYNLERPAAMRSYAERELIMQKLGSLSLVHGRYHDANYVKKRLINFSDLFIFKYWYQT
jgi:nitroreductase